MKGKVYIIGAGPGSYDLMTLKAERILKNADVILYDELIGDDVKKFINSLNAIAINVGKRKGKHWADQSKINELMVKFASEGKKVARVKGGDPFIFGRGGEEIEYLAENGIEFEIVPGITSAIAGPAYAGIPLTHRDYDSAVVILTGREARQDGRLDWELLAKLKATLVILMGVTVLEKIVERLLKYGKDPNTPVAIVEKATTDKQRVIVGKLSNIVEIAKKENVEPPAVIVIGDVVSIREKTHKFLKFDEFQS